MSDLIRREDAIEAVWKPQVKPNELIFDALKTAIESEINNVPSADRPQGWIPCSERLPEKDGQYLTVNIVLDDVLVYKTLHFTRDLYEIDDFDFANSKGKSGWYCYDEEYGYCKCDVEAWMPIKPYERSRR